MSECTHDCSSCSSDCGERKQEWTDFLEKPHEGTHIKKVVGVISGKGGVGKSLVTSMLAVLMNRAGFRTAVLDADITGPSIPTAFGINGYASGSDEGIIPAESENGIRVMSLNLIIQNKTDPVVWRGPVIAGAVKQFWTDVLWGDVDFLFVDMPPGTGDVPLTVFQSIPLDGVVVVASPQELVGMIVEKAVRMTEMLPAPLPILALVENMSYFKCPDCGKEHRIFGESHIDEIAARHGIDTVCKLPINMELAALVDEGRIEQMTETALDPIAALLKDMI